MAATITEIAKKAGVSIATVSRVLNKTNHPINEKTRQRILDVAREMNYQPNLVARSLRTESTYTVGIIIDNMQSPFIPLIINGIQDALKPAGYLSFILNTYEDQEIETQSINALNKRQIDGIIFVAPWDRSPKMVEEMTEKPYVFVHRHFESYCENSVVVDERYGARLAVSHLADLGHRRIALVNGTADWDASIYRQEGYRQELEARGIAFDPDLVIESGWEYEDGIAAAHKLPQFGDVPTAIFAANDCLALGLIYTLQENGIRVPEDVAVVGYDDREFSSFVRPQITTVTLPCYELGKTAAEQLLQMMKDEFVNFSPVQVRGRLVVRESCGEKAK